MDEPVPTPAGSALDPGAPGARAGASRRRRRWLLAAVSVLASLLVAEGLARALVAPPVRVEITVGGPLLGATDISEKVVQSPRRLGQSLFLATPTGRRLRPNTTVTVDKHFVSGVATEVRTNSLGFRNREVGPKTGRRILFLGDSITLADYLPEEQCFVRQVETLARAKGLDWETINAGVSGVSLKTELAILVESGLPLQPDVVVLGWYLNDFQDSPGVQVNAHGFLARHSRLAYTLGRFARVQHAVAGADEPMRAWWPAWTRDVMPELIGGDQERRGGFYLEVGSAFNDWGGAWSDPAWSVMQPLLEELAHLCRASGARPAWLALPSKQQVEAAFDTSQPQQRLARIAKEQGVPFLDLLPVLRELQGRAGGPLFFDQCHHTAEASRVLAEAILAWLEEA